MKLTQQDIVATDWASALEKALDLDMVEYVDAIKSNASNSDVYFLTVSYKAIEEVDCPRRLVLKRNYGHDDSAECRFYSAIEDSSERLEVIPSFYFVEYDSETGDS